jgi:hypothetical protein
MGSSTGRFKPKTIKLVCVASLSVEHVALKSKTKQSLLAPYQDNVSQ